MSVDGYIAGPGGEMDWMVWDWDDALKNYVASITAPVDCIILGRKLAEGFIPYWAANTNEEGAEKMNNTSKVVFTKTLDQSAWDNTILAKGELVDEITRLKKQPGNDIIVYGGATFVSALVKEGLIDEYFLLINPAIISNGLAIFNTVDSQQKLILVKATSFDCGIVALNYVPDRS